MESMLDKVNMGKRIRAARETQGWTREQLAEMLGLSVNSIANIESGKSATHLEYFAALCRLLHVNADYILFGEGEQSLPVQQVAGLMQQCSPADRERLAAMVRAYVEHGV